MIFIKPVKNVLTDLYHELQNVGGALTQNRRMFATILFWANLLLKILMLKKAYQRISKPF